MYFSIRDTADIVTALAALIGVGLAVYGFNAWRDQLRGKTNYELARRYLRAVYKIRDTVKSVRNSFMSNDEISSALNEANKRDAHYKDSAEKAVYVQRWKKVVESKSDLEVELLEAEVSWGESAIEVEKNFETCVRKLFAALKIYIEVEGVRPDMDIIREQGKQINTIRN